MLWESPMVQAAGMEVVTAILHSRNGVVPISASSLPPTWQELQRRELGVGPGSMLHPGRRVVPGDHQRGT